MKRILSILSLGTLLVLLIAINVSAISMLPIPAQAHVQNVTSNKIIALSQYASNDTTSYTFSCNQTEIVANLVGSGHATNFTFHPAANFIGNSRCNITASKATLNTSTQEVTFNIVSQATNIAITAPSITWIKTVANSLSPKIRLDNTGNVELENIAASLAQFTESNNASNNFIATLDLPATTLGVGSAINITLNLPNIDTKKSATYTATLNLSYKSAFDSSTRITQSTITVVLRDAVTSVQAPSQITLGSTSESRNKNVTSSFSILNNGDTNITGLVITSNADPKYNILFALSSSSNFSGNLTISLFPGESKTVNVNGFIPASQQSGSNID